MAGGLYPVIKITAFLMMPDKMIAGIFMFYTSFPAASFATQQKIAAQMFFCLHMPE
jgi:hypothetical protein